MIDIPYGIVAGFALVFILTWPMNIQSRKRAQQKELEEKKKSIEDSEKNSR